VVVLQLRLALGRRIEGVGYFHASREGIVQVAEWLPRVSPEFSSRIQLRLNAPDGMTVALGSLENARELPIAASRRYRTLRGTAGDTRIRVLYLPTRLGHATAQRTLRDARRAVSWIAQRLGPTPRRTITIDQINSTGLAYAWPGIIWLSSDLEPGDVRIYIAHELAHQWFGGIVATRNRRQNPFAAEGPSELMSRLFYRTFRPSGCPGRRLDLPKAAYGSCLYDVIYVDGANVLNRVRRRMGDGAFWRALRGYLRQHRFETVTTADLIDALVRAAPARVRPILRPRFPSLVR
jgi:hypothetical protein